MTAAILTAAVWFALGYFVRSIRDVTTETTWHAGYTVGFDTARKRYLGTQTYLRTTPEQREASKEFQS